MDIKRESIDNTKYRNSIKKHQITQIRLVQNRLDEGLLILELEMIEPMSQNKIKVIHSIKENYFQLYHLNQDATDEIQQIKALSEDISNIKNVIKSLSTEKKAEPISEVQNKKISVSVKRITPKKPQQQKNQTKNKNALNIKEKQSPKKGRPSKNKLKESQNKTLKAEKKSDNFLPKKLQLKRSYRDLYQSEVFQQENQHNETFGSQSTERLRKKVNYNDEIFFDEANISFGSKKEDIINGNDASETTEIYDSMDRFRRKLRNKQ